MDVWNDTAAGNCCFNESIELLISSDGKLKMPWGNSLDLQILGSVSRQLEDLSGQILQHSSTIDCSSGTNSAVRSDSALEESVQTTDRELETSL